MISKMKVVIFKIQKIGVIISLFCLSTVAFADGEGETGGTLSNWLSVGTVPEFLNALFKDIAEIGAAVLAIMIVYTGFLFVKAQGNETKLAEAKKSFTWVIIGGAVILGAWVLSEAIEKTIMDITVPPTP